MLSTKLSILYNGHPPRPTMTQIEVKQNPRIVIQNPDSGKYYTVLMVDPDAPVGTFLHWIVANIQYGGSNVIGAEEWVSYYPPTPPSGTHRYIFYLYQHSKPIQRPKVIKNRAPFDVVAFIQELNLGSSINQVMFRC